MANPNPKNLLDDTGREMLNALRRIYGILSGTEPEMVTINYRDNNYNLLDKTGKQLAESLEGIADALAAGAGTGGGLSPATGTGAGLMSPEDKRKLDAFLPAETYVTRELLAEYTGVQIVPDESQMPEGSEGQIVLVAGTGTLKVFDGQSWVTIATGDGIPESEVLRIIAEEMDAAGG